MFKQMMVPVDLAHVERLDKALEVAAGVARQFATPVCYAGVTAPEPGPLGHNPDEYAKKLSAFGRAQEEKFGLKATTWALIGHDPTIDIDDVLLRAVHESGTDLVVMASHIPGLADYIWPSNGGKIAAHSDASVFVVRNT